MKKGLLYIGVVSAVVSAMLLGACTKGYDELNNDPTKIPENQFEPNYLLSEAQFTYGNTGYSQLLFQSMWPQVLSSTFNYYSNGDKYVASSGIIGYQDRLWNEDYKAGSYIGTMCTLAQSKGYTNLYNIGQIMKVLVLAHLTDCYGDIPYTQALQGKDGVLTPVYDRQDSVFVAMLDSLDVCTARLDASADRITADLFYGGNIAQWKRFGYSLMLRTAMRLTKVDAVTAQKYAEKAVAGGVFTSIADDALALTDNSTGQSNNTSSALLLSDDGREVKWSKTFIDLLRKNNDPRLTVIAEISDTGLAFNNAPATAGVLDSSIQIGMPNGYDLAGGTTNITNAPGYPGGTGTGNNFAALGKYSRPTSSIYRSTSGPNFVLSYAEVQLLLAEAAARGWSVGGSASSHYAAGVSAAIQSLSHFPTSTSTTISATTADAYATANPLDVSSLTASLKAINEQYWLATGSMFNFIETWINWRRSDFPVLTPVVYTGNFTNGTIPRRIPYQSTESANNPTNYALAVSRLTGGDNYTSRVWWDVAQ